MASLFRIVILVGGHSRGSNMQAIIDACISGAIRGEVVGVISTSPESPAMERAASQGIFTAVVPYNAETFGTKLLNILKSLAPDCIALAGFMKKLPEEVVRSYHLRILNVHPALIPSFCGKGMYGENVHKAVVEYGVKYSGCTVHLVDEEYDTGPIILQAVVPVFPEDTPETLAARVLEQEHRIYPEAISLMADGRLNINGRKVIITEKLIGVDG